MNTISYSVYCPASSGCLFLEKKDTFIILPSFYTDFHRQSEKFRSGLALLFLEIRIESLELDERCLLAEIDVIDGMAARLERFDEVSREDCLLVEPVELAEPDLDGAVRIGDDAIGLGDVDL